MFWYIFFFIARLYILIIFCRRFMRNAYFIKIQMKKLNNNFHTLIVKSTWSILFQLMNIFVNK